MTKDTSKTPEILATQLRSIPVMNNAVSVESSAAGNTILTAPLNSTRWSRVLRRVFPIREKRKFELDSVSSELLAMFNGKNTVEAIIEAHMNRWKLSFFEARGLTLEFLRRMTKLGIIALIVPEGTGE